MITPCSLRCEYLENPLGIDVLQPSLSWIPVSTESGQRQSAYRILVASSREKLSDHKGDMWDTGRVNSDETLHIRYGGKPLESRQWLYWKVMVWDKRGLKSGWSETAFWHMGIFTPGWCRMTAWDQPHRPDEMTLWVGEGLDRLVSDKVSPPATYVRTEFEVLRPVKRAMLYATALGLYETRINGGKVGNYLLAPEWTDYRKRIQYQTYDVSALIQEGRNAWGAILGAGWYAGRIGLIGHRHVYGRQPRFFARLYLDYDDGTTDLVKTEGDWLVTTQGPLRENDLLEGEVYDSRQELKGWDRPGYKAEGWRKCWDIGGADSWLETGPLVAQMNEPIRVTTEFHPVAITEPHPCVYILDMTQNMVGWVRAVFRKTKSGQEIRLRHAEMLNPDGTLYLDNMRGAKPVDTYICRGDTEEVYEPRFTYHGFRYVEITGLKVRPEAKDITGRVFHSSCPKTGRLETSNELINRIFHATQWTQYGNLHSTPTDCPQRDERLGWMGDIQVFSQTAIFNMDMAAFFRKFMQDVRDGQTTDGRFPDFAPIPHNSENRFAGNPGWSDAGVIIPWRQWLNYGDLELLERHFDSIKRWIDYVDRISPHHLWEDFSTHTPLTYGDWLNSDTFINHGGQSGFPKGLGQLDKVVYATAFFAYSTRLVSRMAQVLQRKADARKYGALANAIVQSFRNNFVKPDGKLHVKPSGEELTETQNASQPKRARADVQAGYALALNFGLIPKAVEFKSAKQLVEALKPFNGHMSTGIQTTVRLMLELSRHGFHKDAYELITKTSIPSWGYMVKNGATTIWERWDGYDPEKGFQSPGMNSFNHYAIGAVGEWMYRIIGGINPDENAPGWKHFIVKPVPGGGLTYARCEYDSIRGRIQTEWKIEKETFSLKVTIPCNTSATVILPSQKPVRKKVGSGTWEFQCRVVNN
ncbi:MAG: glycoside hydrolase family 78 protein [Verrucomicrobiae bacterium]|nr:glycoside hydrolase family 78 protein [Verrucomicrobiae bacterium]